MLLIYATVSLHSVVEQGVELTLMAIAREHHWRHADARGRFQAILYCLCFSINDHAFAAFQSFIVLQTRAS